MERQRYSTDLTDAQWALRQPHFPPVDRPDKHNGRPRVYSYREILNGIFYINRAGCVWALMPHDLPPWLTCAYYFILDKAVLVTDHRAPAHQIGKARNRRKRRCLRIDKGPHEHR